MIINLREANSRVSVSRDFVTSQKFHGTHWVLGSGSMVVTASEGIGILSAASAIAALDAAGFADQRITLACKWISPSTVGAHDIGAMLRFQTIQASDDNYYYACIRNGNAEIRKVLNTAFSTLATSAWVLPEGEVATITFSCVHDPISAIDQLSATFSAATPGSVTLSTTDDDLFGFGWGGCGMRTQNAAGYFRTVLLEQL